MIAAEALAKKPYRAPKLSVYGDLKEITRGTGGGKPDHGNSQQHKT
jgi:hypothetical protein